MTTRILVVDDSPIDCCLVGGLLQQGIPGVVIEYADNGKLSLEAIASAMPDVIISDLQMPEMNGLELVENIQARGHGVPVILMTSHGNEQIAVQALQAGAASYVPKRSLAKDLVETVQNVLSVSQRQTSRRRVLGTLTGVETRFVLESDTSLITPMIAYLQEQIATMRLSDDLQLMRIGVVMHESLTNAIYHGNLELDSELRQVDESIFYSLAKERRRDDRYSARRVHLTAQLSATEVRLVVRDDGPGFDPSELRNPTDEINMDRIGGRGLLLIRSFMDEVSHNARGNEITMVKRATLKPQN